MDIRHWLLIVVLILPIIFDGCGLSKKQEETETVESIAILVYADNRNVARNVALYFEDNPRFLISPTADIQMLNTQNIMSFSVILLIPVGEIHFPPDILNSLKDFVHNGGGIIGMYSVLSQQPEMMYEIFGGSVGISPTDTPFSRLFITIHGHSPVTEGIPETFTLVGERQIITKYEQSVHRLLDMTYETATGEEKNYCAGWSQEYGKGKVFFFAPGAAEETRYNPYIIRMINNAVLWMIQNKG